MSNILILSENEVLKSDLSDQIKHHIPDFEITENWERKTKICIYPNGVIVIR